MSRVILNEIISLKNQQSIFVIEDEGVFCTEKRKYRKLRSRCVAEELPAKTKLKLIPFTMSDKVN